MAKIIQLSKRELPPIQIKREDRFEDILNWVSEMNNILQLIEKSIEKTPAYVPKDLNCRR